MPEYRADRRAPPANEPSQRETLAALLALSAALDQHRAETRWLVRALWLVAALIGFGVGGWVISR